MSAQLILEHIAKTHGFTVAQLRGPWRHRKVVVARHEAMLWLRLKCSMSYPEIARALGRDDHTTAIHGVERAFAALKCRGRA